MNIDNLASMFSQSSGVQQSMGSTIMSAIISFMAQKMMGQGLGGMLSGGGSSGGSGGMQSMLSGLGGLNRDHELVKHVQQDAGIKDPETARQYTQQGVDVINEQSRNDPQGLQSLLGGFLGAGSGGNQHCKGQSGRGLGGMVGDILGG
jgi:hypothetical protein